MLEKHIEEIRANLKAGRFTNEAAVSQGIVNRLLGALGWPTYDTQVIYPEFPLEGRAVDFALCHPPGKPCVFIEVKKVGGTSNIGERQLFEYAFHLGVPMAILTDGQEWHFFLPGEQGEYQERRVYMLDLVDRSTEETASRLRRYLDYQSVCSGKAVEAARKEYKDVSRERDMRRTFPKAWRMLIEGEDELLLELLAEQVEGICGYRPDPDAVSEFLRDHALVGGETPKPRAASTRPAASPVSSPKRGKRARTTAKGFGFDLKGEWSPARSARAVLVRIFGALADRDESFLERFASLPKHVTRRRYLARSPEECFPHRPDMARDHTVELRPNWWLTVNNSKRAVEKIIRMACEVAGLRFGKDLKIDLGD